MLTVEEAQAYFLKQAKGYSIQETEDIAIKDALGRTLAKDIVSTINVPPADNSAMDGYAINTQDLQKNTRLAVSQTIAAGHIAQPLKVGTAARIFTGAEIPEGANAVVMQEQCQQCDDKIEFPKDIPVGNNIRRSGQDIQEGDIILSKGSSLQAQDLGLLASIGMATVDVYRPITVAILSSGDELAEPGTPLTTGKIYNSNRYLLHGFLSRMNIHCMDIGVTEDNLDATEKALIAASKADCIITTGGVSVGDEDHIKKAINNLGSLDLWRIAIKPGKPVALGHVDHEKKQTPIIGLPGNPASVFITFLLFAKPFLNVLQNTHPAKINSYLLPANFSNKANPKRQEYLRAKINEQGTVDIYPNQSSGVLSSTCWADGLVIKPAGQTISPDMPVRYIPFNEFFND